MGEIEHALFILQGFVDAHPAASVRDVEALAAARAELTEMQDERDRQEAVFAGMKAQMEHGLVESAAQQRLRMEMVRNLCRVELAALRAQAEPVGCGGDKSTLRVVTDSWKERE